jgi:hypothetical protein
MAMLVSVSHARGNTVKSGANQLKVPCSEVCVERFNDPYQVPRVLKALMDAPVAAAGAAPQSGWVERVMRTPLLSVTPAGTPAKSATA